MPYELSQSLVAKDSINHFLFLKAMGCLRQISSAAAFSCSIQSGIVLFCSHRSPWLLWPSFLRQLPCSSFFLRLWAAPAASFLYSQPCGCSFPFPRVLAAKDGCEGRSRPTIGWIKERGSQRLLVFSFLGRQAEALPKPRP
jgi:hypothetical protein